MDSQDSIQKQLEERRQRLAHGANAPQGQSNQSEPMDLDESPFANNRHQLEQEIVSLSSREHELQNELTSARQELLARRARLGVLRSATSQSSDSSISRPQEPVPEAAPRPVPELTQEEKDHEIAVMLQRQWERENEEERRREATQNEQIPPQFSDSGFRPDSQPEPQPQQSRSSFAFSIRSGGDGGPTFAYSSSNGGPPPELAHFMSSFDRDPFFGGMRGFGFADPTMDREHMRPFASNPMGGFLGPSGFLSPRAQRSPFGRIGFSPFLFGSAGVPFGVGGMNLDLDNMDHDQILRLQEMIGNVPRGASTQEISELPTSKFHESEGKEEATENEDRKKCSICLEEFSEGDDIRTLPCFHIFHADEIDQWLRQNSKCPICREPIQSAHSEMET